MISTFPNFFSCFFLSFAFFFQSINQIEKQTCNKKQCSPASFPQLSSYLSFLSCPFSFSPSFHFRIIYIYKYACMHCAEWTFSPDFFFFYYPLHALSLPLSISLFLSLLLSLSLSPFSPGRGLERLASDGGLTASQRPSWGLRNRQERMSGYSPEICTNPLSLSHLALKYIHWSGHK